MSEYAKQVLVDTAWVEEHLNDESIRIVEVDENPALYAEAHIPGAIGFDWKLDLQDQLKRDFLGPADFGALVGSRGISNEHTIVLYGDRNNWFAAYTYWYLKYYGHDKVRLVNGPREKWVAEGRRTTDEVPSYAPTTFVATPIREPHGPPLEALPPSCFRIAPRSPARKVRAGREYRPGKRLCRLPEHSRHQRHVHIDCGQMTVTGSGAPAISIANVQGFSLSKTAPPSLRTPIRS